MIIITESFTPLEAFLFVLHPPHQDFHHNQPPPSPGFPQKPSVVGVWIFSGNTQSQLLTTSSANEVINLHPAIVHKSTFSWHGSVHKLAEHWTKKGLEYWNSSSLIFRIPYNLYSLMSCTHVQSIQKSLSLKQHATRPIKNIYLK